MGNRRIGERPKRFSPGVATSALPILPVAPLFLRAANLDAASVSGQAFDRRDAINVVGEVFEPGLVEAKEAVPANEVVAGQAAGEARRTARRENVRRPGGVVAERDRGVIAEENRARAGDFFGEFLGVSRRDVQVFRRDFVRNAASLVRVAGQNNGAEVFERLASERAPFDPSERRVDLGDRVAERFFVPTDQDARARRVFRLREDVVSGIIGAGRLVDDNDDFARPGDRIDVDGAVNRPLGESDEEVPRPDDFVDPRDSFDPERERRDALRAPHSVNFFNAETSASRQKVRVVRTVRRRRRHYRDLLDARDLRRNDRHQDRRRIGRRAARDAAADATKRSVALPEPTAGPLDSDVAAQNRTLENGDIFRDSVDGAQKFRLDLVERGVEFLLRDAELVGGQVGAVDSFRVIEERREAFFGDVATNRFGDFGGRQRRAENLDRATFALFANDISFNAQFLTERVDFFLNVVLTSVDPLEVERGLSHFDLRKLGGMGGIKGRVRL